MQVYNIEITEEKTIINNDFIVNIMHINNDSLTHTTPYQKNLSTEKCWILGIIALGKGVSCIFNKSYRNHKSHEKFDLIEIGLLCLV